MRMNSYFEQVIDDENLRKNINECTRYNKR